MKQLMPRMLDPMIRMDPPVTTAYESMFVPKRAPFQTLMKPQNIERKLIGSE
jgi:hypothetical protein